MRAGAKPSGVAGWNERRSGGMARRDAGGRRAGSVRAAKVASLPGASAEAVRVERARESSPRRTCSVAFARRRSGAAWSEAGCGPRGGPGARASASNCAHRPRRKASTRPSRVRRPTAPLSRARRKRRRGVRRKSFHARWRCVALARSSTIMRRLRRKAARAPA